MESGKIEVYCGNGRGKTSLAIAQGFRACIEGQSTIIIQFLKGKEKQYLDYLEEKGDLDIKIFRFEKHHTCYEQLNEEQQVEERNHIMNALHFARKVIQIQECDVLILDEILGLLENGIITAEELGDLLKQRGPDMSIILTGRTLPEELKSCVDSITVLETTDRE